MLRVWLPLLALSLLPALLAAQQQPTSVSGVVRDVAGRPLADAEIVIGRRSASTGTEGRFVLDSVAPTRHLLVVRLIGYMPLRQELDLTRGAVSPLELELIAAPVYLPMIVVEGTRSGIYGTVTDHESTPSIGARVEVRGPRGGEALTDSAGRFAFPRATGGQYMVRVTQPGFVERRMMLEVDGGREVTVTLLPGFTAHSRAAERAAADLSQRLVMNLNRERIGPSDLGMHRDARLCDVPMARIVIPPHENAVLFVNGIRYFRSYGDNLLDMLCAWRADEVELLEFGRSLGHDVTRTLALLVGATCGPVGRNLGGRAADVRPPSGSPIGAGITCGMPYVVVWEKR